jgi:tetratricopeptide (TPR) repeat protein
MEAGQLDAALAIFKDTLAAAERTHMSDRRIVAMLYMNMGNIHRSQGRNAEARLAMETAIAIHTEVSGAESLDVARSRSNLAIVLVELKRTDEALAQLAIAIAIQEKLLGPDNPTLAMALGLSGSLLAMNGKPSLGLAPLERAVALRTKAGLPCDPNMCYWLARALTATGGDPGRAQQLTADARAAFIATGNPQATEELDAWVATRQKPRGSR